MVSVSNVGKKKQKKFTYVLHKFINPFEPHTQTYKSLGVVPVTNSFIKASLINPVVPLQEEEASDKTYAAVNLKSINVHESSKSVKRGGHLTTKRNLFEPLIFGN